MCEAVETFRQALAEQGLDAEVVHESNDLHHVFSVSKNINGEHLVYNTTIDETAPDLDKRIAVSAREVARKMQEQLTDSFEWQDRAIEIALYDEPEAICRRCGESVSISLQKHFSASAELSLPHPTPVERETLLESMDGHSEVLLKMYLIGKLRDSCEEYCTNAANERGPFTALE